MLKMTSTVMAGFAALALTAAPALAVTVTNMTDKAHEVTVDHGAEEPKVKIDAGQSAKIDCPAGCELRIPTVSYGLSAQPGDKAVIGKDNMLAYQDAGAKDATKRDAKSKTN